MIDKWALYEREEAKLVNLPPQEYERELKKLIQRLHL